MAWYGPGGTLPRASSVNGSAGMRPPKTKRSAFKQMLAHTMTAHGQQMQMPNHVHTDPYARQSSPPPSLEYELVRQQEERAARDRADMANKREERQIRAAHRRHRRQKRGEGDDDDDFLSLKTKLETHGLTLRQITGDGNCLFRAFSDQLYGASDRHPQLRADTVEFMRAHRDDFEPFLLEHQFDRHLELLAKDGTFTGNDSIVAFSRLHRVTVVIHQLNEPLWQVHGSPDGSKCTRELHVSYHNGDHYNSVRRISEPANARCAANVAIDATVNGHKNGSSSAASSSPAGSADANRKGKKGGKSTSASSASSLAAVERNGGARCHHDDDDEDEQFSDYENATVEDARVQKVMRRSGITDAAFARTALEENANCVDAAVDHIMQINQMQLEANAAPIWRPGGTANRILGEDAAKSATWGGQRGRERGDGRPGAGADSRTLDNRNRDKLEAIKEKRQNGGHLTNKQRQKLQKEEKRLEKDARDRAKRNQQRVGEGDDDDGEGRDVQPIVANLQALNI